MVYSNVVYFSNVVVIGGPKCGGVDYVFGVRDVARALSLITSIIELNNTTQLGIS